MRGEALLAPRFQEGDVIITPWGNDPGRPVRVSLVHTVLQCAHQGPAYPVLEYDTVCLETGALGGFTNEAEGIEKVRLVGE